MAKRTTEGNTKGRKKTVNIQSRGVITKGKHWKREDNDTKIMDDPRVKTQISSQVKQQGKTVKIPGGRGLGKAGAKRLGKLLKRAIQEKKNVTGNEKLPLPTTPVRLFKYQTQKGKVVTRVSQLILRVVSQCKSRGGISMVELKQALSAGGYDVTKNNSRVNLAVKGLVTKETLLQTMGGGASRSFRLNKKNRSDEKNVKTRAMRKCEKLRRGSVPTVEKRKAARTAVTKAKPAGKSPTRDRRDAKSSTKVRGNGYKTRRQQKTARLIHKNTITDLGNKKSRIQRRRAAK